MSKQPSKYSKKKEFYVYVLLDPRKKGKFSYSHWKFEYEPFYVGKGKRKRAQYHCNKSTNTIVTRKINKIKNLSLYPIIDIKKNKLTEKQAFLLEVKLIEKIGRLGLKTGPLANMTSGGDGVKRISQETKEKISKNTIRQMKDMGEEEKLARSLKISIGLKNAYSSGRRNALEAGKNISKAKLYKAKKLGSFFERMSPKRRKKYSKNISERIRRFFKSQSEEERKTFREKMKIVNTRLAFTRKNTILVSVGGNKIPLSHLAKILGVSFGAVRLRIRKNITIKNILQEFDPDKIKITRYLNSIEEKHDSLS